MCGEESSNTGQLLLIDWYVSYGLSTILVYLKPENKIYCKIFLCVGDNDLVIQVLAINL